jgi:hypothetical protein
MFYESDKGMQMGKRKKQYFVILSDANTSERILELTIPRSFWGEIVADFGELESVYDRNPDAYRMNNRLVKLATFAKMVDLSTEPVYLCSFNSTDGRKKRVTVGWR